MTTGPNRILDEFAKLLTDAAGAAQGVRREVETAFRGQAEKILNTMDVVQREEFEAVRDMAVKARAENKKLASRLETLEASLAALEAGAGKIPGEDPLEEPKARTRRTTKGDPQK
ncbi:accessory factor UbiK family protein [Mesorhizobium sp. LHD-90]|uniref:accessory factor UbiK family protein n=1 Tax=Mesorhizobium sp. LHD-90 TaxID=3071414 RepID=UPI0027DFEEBC|nr:accessory factor UbiK family protein [Mesorhizobium sp. LHD-90]MDQ6436694.1 accessory factor UbiK family protein [Mesorhizobium sp. LHD-90]